LTAALAVVLEDIQDPEGTDGQFVQLVEDLPDKAVAVRVENGRADPTATPEEALDFTEKDNPDMNQELRDPAGRIKFTAVAVLGTVTLEQAAVLVLLEFSGY
jgi:hypothetical protein